MPEMTFASRSIRSSWATVLTVGLTLLPFAGAQDVHGRKYQEPPPLAHIVVTVEKGFNGKPLPNAAVIFHATKNGKDSGNLEIKTDPDGKAAMDLIEVGSHLTVQVIANGFATYASEFDVSAEPKDLLVKLERPQAQVSQYTNNDGKASQMQPGIQEPRHLAPHSQSAGPTNAIVSGTITDSGGAPIPGAVVTIRSATGKQSPVRMLTAEDGSFRRSDVAPGTYDVTISAIGFQNVAHAHVVLDRGDERIFDDRLPALPQ
jgi:uncharacterized surface anchored protein